MNIRTLVERLKNIDDLLTTQAVKAVNASLTLRNWLIGWHISEYELHGEDRGEYGRQLFTVLARDLTGLGLSNCNRRQLYRYRDFYRAYPQIVGTLSPQLQHLRPERPTPPEKVGTPSPRSGLATDILLNRLSYSHFELLTELAQPLKRAFYEIECIKGSWSVRELERQIVSLYFERSGLSRDKEKLSAMANAAAIQAEPRHIIRDPYVFEFLGLRPQEVLPESDLEAALIGRLQDFLLELGRGFCFEARQKRILIGDEHFFVDLVFYHRILKCHVLIDLKVAGFTHEYLGQLNTYVTWFREHEMAENDNPPVGILLCTKKNHALVKYALAGMDNRLFVSKYELQLPDEAQIKAFLEDQYRQLQRGQPEERE